MLTPQFAITFNSFIVLLFAAFFTVITWDTDEPVECGKLTREFWRSQDGVPWKYTLWMRAIHLLMIPLWIFVAFFYSEDYFCIILLLLLRHLFISILNRLMLGKWF